MTTSARKTEGHERVPELRPGDHLKRDEFERRYRAMPFLKKAELIEGVVYMPSPVSTEGHGDPHFRAGTWLGVYVVETPGIQGADNATVLLDDDNEPQPDLMLRILPEFGGQTLTVDGYVEGGPELALEVAASSVSYDLHSKLRVYLYHGVREYVVWRVEAPAVDWFVRQGDQFVRQGPDADGVLRSQVFPGLWLDAGALLEGNQRQVLAVLRSGLEDPSHRAFVATLAAARR